MKRILQAIAISLLFPWCSVAGVIDDTTPDLGTPAQTTDYIVTYDASSTTNGKISGVRFPGTTGVYLDGTGNFVSITSGVSSFNGRTGDVTPQQSDYDSYFLALASCTTDGQIPVWNGTTLSWECGAASGTGDLLSTNNLSDVASALTSFDNIKQDATDAYSGVVELSTDTEAVTGTDTTRAVTPANLTARLAAPGDIGATTPGAGTFTTVSADSFSVSQTATGPQYTQLYEDSDNGTDARGISAPPAITSSLLFQLPDGDPTAGQVITWGAPTTQTMSDGFTATVTVGTFADMSGGTGGYVAVPTYSDESCTEGEYAVDHTNGYIYRCIATDTWDRYAVTFDNWSNPTPVPYTLTVTDPGNGDAIQWDLTGADPIDCGNGATDCTTTQNNGTTITGITAVPASGRQFDAWTGDITGTTATDGSATFSADITGSATFSTITGTLDCTSLGTWALMYNADHVDGETTACVQAGTTLVSFTGVTADSTINMTTGGVYGINWPGTADSYLAVPPTGLATDSGHIEVDVMIVSTDPAADIPVFEWGVAGASIYAKLQYNATYGYRVQANHDDGTLTQAVTTYVAMTPGTAYTVVVDWNSTTGEVSATFDGNSATTAGGTVAAFTTPSTDVYFGESALNLVPLQNIGFDNVYFSASTQ